MFIEYENSREDYIKGYEKLRKTTIKVRTITSGIAVFAVLLFPIYHIYRMSTFYTIGVKEYIEVFLIGGITYTLLMLILNKNSKKEVLQLVDTNLNLKPAFIGKKSIELIDGKIIHKSKSDYAEYNISGINNIFEYNNQVLLCVQKLNPMFIIPSEAFTSDEQKQEFIKIIKSQMNFVK